MLSTRKTFWSFILEFRLTARAFYSFFGRQAWGQDQGAACSLAQHQAASLKATEEAEKHLRARIETVLGNVCRGFVASDGRVTYTEEERAAIFDSATMAIYRILFALYAEARDLLPMRNAGYREQSLTGPWPSGRPNALIAACRSATPLLPLRATTRCWPSSGALTAATPAWASRATTAGCSARLLRKTASWSATS